MHRPLTKETTSSHTARDKPCSFTSNSTWTNAGTIWPEIFTRLTALTIPRTNQTLCADKWHPSPLSGPNFRFHEFTNTLGINTLQGIHIPERINYTSTPPQHTLKPTASSCSLGQLENEYVQEGRDRELPMECTHFAIKSRFTERFCHLLKYFFASADRPNDYLNTFFTRDTAPYKIYAK